MARNDDDEACEVRASHNVGSNDLKRASDAEAAVSAAKRLKRMSSDELEWAAMKATKDVVRPFMPRDASQSGTSATTDAPSDGDSDSSTSTDPEMPDLVVPPETPLSAKAAQGGPGMVRNACLLRRMQELSVQGLVYTAPPCSAWTDTRLADMENLD